MPLAAVIVTNPGKNSEGGWLLVNYSWVLWEATLIRSFECTVYIKERLGDCHL